jgi:Xaa-Pro aminopeptidase
VADGYNSDETVTIIVEGQRDLSLPSPLPRRGGDGDSFSPSQRREREERSRQREIHQIVYDAQQYAIEKVKPGVKCSDVDKAARDYITKKGYGKYFGHALGHGVGLEVHERPVLSPNSTDVLEAGMVFTIEPGIYIPKFGGVRIEDVFVCTKKGVRQISQIQKSH